MRYWRGRTDVGTGTIPGTTAGGFFGPPPPLGPLSKYSPTDRALYAVALQADFVRKVLLGLVAAKEGAAAPPIPTPPPLFEVHAPPYDMDDVLLQYMGYEWRAIDALLLQLTTPAIGAVTAAQVPLRPYIVGTVGANPSPTGSTFFLSGDQIPQGVSLLNAPVFFGGSAPMFSTVASNVGPQITLASPLPAPPQIKQPVLIVVPNAISANITGIGGTPVTAADWTAYFENLQNLTALSTTTAPRGVTVSTGAAQRVDTGFANRRSVAITNTDSTNPVFLGFGKAADSSNPVTTSATAATCGLQVGPNGGSYSHPDGPDISIWAAAPAPVLIAIVESA